MAKPDIVIVEEGEKPRRLCGSWEGSKTIRFRHFKFVTSSFTAPEWPAHEKYYCPQCNYLWSSWLDNLTLEEYGRKYLEANFDYQRRPAEERMRAAPNLLRDLIRLTGGNRFLDYGVGYNVPYIYEIRGRDIDLWGCDISAGVPYSRYIRQIPGETLPVGTFDGIYSLDVAEHLSDVIGDYLRMKDLLKPGGYILHSTYWLHELWKPGEPFPENPMLHNPWHVSICSERTMCVIASKTGLEFVQSLPVKTDTQCAYLLRKPGKKHL